MKTYSFEELACWKHARQLAVWTYKITSSFPVAEKFGMISQMRRAAISIASDLAEGTSRLAKRIRLILVIFHIAVRLNC